MQTEGRDDDRCHSPAVVLARWALTFVLSSQPFVLAPRKCCEQYCFHTQQLLRAQATSRQGSPNHDFAARGHIELSETETSLL